MAVDILTDERKIVVIGWLPIDFFELEDMIIVSEAYFEKVIYGQGGVSNA